MARTASLVAGGDLTPRAKIGGRDELEALGEAFNAMTGNLVTAITTEKQRRKQVERLLASIREAVGRLTSTTRRSWPAPPSKP